VTEFWRKLRGDVLRLDRPEHAGVQWDVSPVGRRWFWRVRREGLTMDSGRATTRRTAETLARRAARRALTL